jgi:hypothetical protein
MKSITSNFSVKTLFPAAALAISIILLVYSLLQQPIQSYEFPIVFIAAMVLLSLIWLIQEVFFGEKPIVEEIPWKPIISGVIIISGYLFLAHLIGFLPASILVFFITGVYFSPDRKSIKNIITVVVSAAIFMGVVYSLFNLMLKVQVPTGMF